MGKQNGCLFVLLLGRPWQLPKVHQMEVLWVDTYWMKQKGCLLLLLLGRLWQ